MTPIVTLLQGDSIALMNDPPGGIALTPKEGRVFKADAVVADPPYGFDFDGTMCKRDWAEGQVRVEGNDWDKFQDSRSLATGADDAEQFARFTERWIRAAESILWPGAHLMIFSADRTIGRVSRGMELANLDIVRMVAWLYASGQVKTKTDLRPAMEPIQIGRYFGEMGKQADLNDLFKRTGRGQLHAQTWKAEDGQHPTNVIIDQSLVDAYEEVAQVVTEHPGAFFVPKPSSKDRDWGCADLPVRQKSNRLSHMSSDYTGKVVKPVMAQNIHPTVKPITLMRRMIRLISRPGHTILDPFMGSGTCGVAAVLEGRHYIGIEREPEYFQIARTRISSALVEVGGPPLAAILPNEAELATS